jgi:phosphate regulon transcriptional regulator PhoB
LKRVLIVEDDHDIIELVRYNLEREGYRVTHATDGVSGLESARRELPDLLILDLMLPQLSGLQLCQEIRRTPRTAHLPIIMLTARSDEADRVVGLELGADDYVTKPFSPRELVARVKAVLRRAEPLPVGQPIRIGSLEIEPDSHQVKVEGKAIELSALEFRLLHFLASHPGRVFSRDQLLDQVWGADRFVTPRSVDVYMRRLRERVEKDPENPQFLKTVRGAGYKFTSGED